PAQRAEGGEQRQLAEAGEPVARDREQWPGAEQYGVNTAGDAGGDDEGDEGAGGELEQQQLDGEHDSGERRAGPGGPSRGGSFRAPPPCGAAGPRGRRGPPPVTMMGPSAPKGPPVPIATAADNGLATAVLGATRLRLVSTASIASGMPWPRMMGDQRARSV